MTIIVIIKKVIKITKNEASHMSNKDIITTTFKDFNFAIFIATLGPKMNAVVNANCYLDYHDISKTYKSILENIGIDSNNYVSFRKAFHQFFKERDATKPITTTTSTENKIVYIPPKRITIFDKYNWQFVFQYGFFPNINESQIILTLKDLYVSSMAHGCRFLPDDTNEDLDLERIQFESFVDYEPYVELIQYQKIESIVTSKNWYKFIECKLHFDSCFQKYSKMIERYVIQDAEVMATRKELIFQILNQNGEVNITNSYVDSSIESLNFNGISLFELSILQTLSVGSLKYDPHGSALIGKEDTIKKFKTIAKKRRPIQVIKKLSEIAVILGYNAVVVEPSDQDIQDVHDLILSFIKHFNEVKFNLEEYIQIILEIGIDNAKIDIKTPGVIESINTKSMIKV
jgi:hypothetical protein